jgi:hypothetical protein
MIPYRRFRGWRRRLLIGGIVLTALGALALLALFVIYPRVGESTIREKLVPRLAAKLGRPVSLRTVDVRLGHATLRGLEVAGAGGAPQITVDQIDVEFDVLPSLVGTAKVRSVQVVGVRGSARRRADGTDDVRDMVDRWRGRGGAAVATGGGGLGALRPATLLVRGIEATIVDELTGVTGTVGGGDADLSIGTPARVTLRDLHGERPGGPSAVASALTIERGGGGTPTFRIEGGAGELWTGMALTGIAGTIAPHDGGARLELDLAGGYGGVEGRLWTAKGQVEPRAGNAVVDLVAQKFMLDRLRPVLEGTAVIEPERTSVDADLHLELAASGVTFRGGFHVADLNVTHPMIADKPVRALDFAGDVAGRLDRATKTLTLSRGEFITGEVPLSFTGALHIPGGMRELAQQVRGALRGGGACADCDDDLDDDLADPAPPPTTPGKGKEPAVVARRDRPTLDVRLVVPPVDCQRALDAIPKEAAPYLAGYQLAGTYQANLHLAIDWGDLDRLVLDGIDSRLGLGGCKVLRAPADSPLRLRGEFEHFVEVERDKWVSVWIGPSNPDFISIDSVSPYLPRSLQTTEDSAFFSHHGFITREFRSALISNLKSGRFRHGASSISMQLVKNVLLYREKTLARKLQELFLTWHMEQVLPKARILEIYINAIEYGPGIYGIGEAARHYFGKSARDLNPVESAFFSSILPNPKERYAQFCAGTLRRTTEAKIGRIVDLMLKRGRLTEEEWTLAKATPLVFARDGLDEAECMGRRSRALRNARPTNPQKK